MLMEMFTAEIGLMIKLMDTVRIRITTVLSMRAIGQKTNSMEEEKRNGLMDLHTTETTKWDLNTVRDSLDGTTVTNMKVISQIIIFKEKENTPGKTGASLKAIGSIIRCMDLVYLHGLMVDGTKASISMIKKKDLEHSFGQVAENTRANG